MAIELQTERLKAETGALRIICEVHHHDVAAKLRFVTLSSETSPGFHVAQSVALAYLAVDTWSPRIYEIDELLRLGGLMGETFRNHGFEVQQLRTFQAHLPVVGRRLAKIYGCARWRFAQVEAYEFWADGILYATVFELKNPARTTSPQRVWRGGSTLMWMRGIYQGFEMYFRTIRLVARFRF